MLKFLESLIPIVSFILSLIQTWLSWQNHQRQTNYSNLAELDDPRLNMEMSQVGWIQLPLRESDRILIGIQLICYIAIGAFFLPRGMMQTQWSLFPLTICAALWPILHLFIFTVVDRVREILHAREDTGWLTEILGDLMALVFVSVGVFIGTSFFVDSVLWYFLLRRFYSEDRLQQYQFQLCFIISIFAWTGLATGGLLRSIFWR